MRSCHLVGIGGSGMASLAAYLLGRGERVSGCDLKDGPMLQLLREQGARVVVGHAAAHVEPGIDVLVHTAAAGPDHRELTAAAAQGVPAQKYAQFLGRETRGRRCCAVAGTHGKTTTSTLLTEILVLAGMDPSAVLGGFPIGWPLPGRAGKGPHFVVEACEYDRSFTNFRPHLALVTNVEPDHLDYFGDMAHVVRAFQDFLANVEEEGCAVLHESAAAELDLALVPGKVLVVGAGEGVDARLERSTRGGGQPGVRLHMRGQPSVELALAPAVPGDHNVTNAALAATAALALGVAPPTIEAAIRAFRGVRRRLESLGTRDGVRFFSDYAHHPTEIRVTRDALRGAWPGRRIVVVFQPHQATRTRDFRSDFADELAGFDEVILPNIFSVRESREGIEQETEQLLLAIRARGRAPTRTHGLADVFDTVRQIARAGDLVVLMGAGDIDDLAEELRSKFREATVA